MTPMFLPHSALDTLTEYLPALTSSEAHGGTMLCALRDRALAEGAQVLLLVWPTFEWVMLAIEVPPDVTIKDAAQLIPNLMANPNALAQMQQNAREGRHLHWLHLLRPAMTTH